MAFPAMLAVGLGSALSAGTSILSGANAQKAGIEQAAVYKQQAQEEMQAAGAKISSEDIEANRALSKAAATAGASGVTAESATPVISEDFTTQKVKDAYTRYSGQLAATSDLYAASLAKYQGNQALFAGIAGGVGSILQGAGDIGQIKMAGSSS